MGGQGGNPCFFILSRHLASCLSFTAEQRSQHCQKALSSLGLVTLPPLALSELGMGVGHSSEVWKTVRSHSLMVSLCPYFVNSFIKTLSSILIDSTICFLPGPG